MLTRPNDNTVFLDAIIDRFLQAPMKREDGGEPTAEIQVDFELFEEASEQVLS